MKKGFINIAVLILVIFMISGCTNQAFESHTDNTNIADEYDYNHSFGNGLELRLKKNILEDNLVKFKFELQNEQSIDNKIEAIASIDDASNCYLIHNSDNEIIKGFGDLSTNVLFFDNVKYDLSEYTLHFECPVSINIDQEYPINIPTTDSKKTYNDKAIELPLNNSIKVNTVSTRNNFDRLSNHCVDIDFMISSKITDFDIRIDKSEISNGAPIGTFTDKENGNYIYSHPISDTEADITVIFKDISINDICKCDIKL